MTSPFLADNSFPAPVMPGFSGIWYANQPVDSPYAFKYSGGMATYPQQHTPVAIYCPKVKRTFFVFGSSQTLPKDQIYTKTKKPEGNTICAISYFDHNTNLLARPRKLIVRDVLDAHENPVLCIDTKGYLIVFCPAHGSKRTSTILRSARPYDITEFTVVSEFKIENNFSYPQPWQVDKHGIVFLHTFYEPGSQRRLAVINSKDSINLSHWDKRQIIVRMAKGSYQISWPDGRGGIGTAFDIHPQAKDEVPLNLRTNLYYMHTSDGGQTWQNIKGENINLPLTDSNNPALVYDAASEGKLVYLKDMQYDDSGNPTIVYLTANSALPGPKGGPHKWWIVKYSKGEWQHFHITNSTHCYDHGSLLLQNENDWRLIAPTAPGLDKYAAGGQMQLLQSKDKGESWKVIKGITDDKNNHTYARRPLNWHKDFACLWADGRGVVPSQSSLYFTTNDGQAYKMPDEMSDDFVKPEKL